MIMCTLSKFADYSKLWGAVGTLEERDAMQRNPEKLERWADANLVKFINVKCKVLVKEASLCDNPGAILAVILAPPELGLKPLCTSKSRSYQISLPAWPWVFHSRASDAPILKIIFFWSHNQMIKSRNIILTWMPLGMDPEWWNPWAFIPWQSKCSKIWELLVLGGSWHITECSVTWLCHRFLCPLLCK